MSSLSILVEQIRALLPEGVDDPAIFKAIFLAGAGGSGKGYVGDSVARGLGFRFIDTDRALVHYLKKAKLSLDMSQYTAAQTQEKDVLRAKAKRLTGRLQQSHEKGRLGLIIDGTGRDLNRMNREKARLEALGYDTYMILVEVPLDVAIERNSSRKRKVDVETVLKPTWEKIEKNKPFFKRMFGKNLFIVKNVKGNSERLAGVRKAIAKISHLPVTNPVAKDWIKAQGGRRAAKGVTHGSPKHSPKMG